MSTIDGDPVLSIVRHTRGTALVLNVSLERSDLALRTAFPLLMAHALAWFQDGESQFVPAYATGETAVRPAPTVEGRSAVTYLLQSPDNQRLPVSPSSHQLLLGPFDQQGVWSLLSEGASGATRGSKTPRNRVVARFACNVANGRESNLLPSYEGSRADALVPAAERWPIWYSLIVAALGLVLAEWWWYQRRWVG